ncbi:MAG: conjugal transfer protein TraR [Ignavibacteria bacterium]|nr:conjugal transfer protein TraR [Ignavibacteria bacterium]
MKIRKKSTTKTKKKISKEKVKQKVKKLIKNKIKRSINKKLSSTKRAIKKTTKPKTTTKKKVTKETVKTKPKNKKTRYTKRELEHFRKILLEERDKILENARANMKSLVDIESGEYVGDNLTYASHMAEQGTDEMEREKNYLFVQRDEKYLGYIQEALIRIDQGTYGVCIDCIEEPKNLCDTCPLIPKERLELVPITQHCIECKKLRG